MSLNDAYKDMTLFIAGSWRLSRSFSNWLKNEVQKIYTGIKWNYVQWEHYKIWNLWEPSTKAVGIITTAREGVEEALEDFIRNDIPTIIASTDLPGYLDNNISIPTCIAPNLNIAVVELMKIFEDMESLEWLNMDIQESHQSGKKDPSGTALDIIQQFRRKWGVCLVANEQKYTSQEWISDLEALRCYRWESSISFGVPREFLWSHAYHTYKVFWKKGEILSAFKEKVQDWQDKNAGQQGSEVFFRETTDTKISEAWDEFYFWHNINGHATYVDGVRKLIPWILDQEAGVYSVKDYLR